MADQQPKVKGVADIVFLLDATGSMAPCIEALKNNISVFIDCLTAQDANNVFPIKDWRAKVIGYRDFREDGEKWFVDNPFVRSASELKAHLAGLKADGGGDEPESALDAIYKVAYMGETVKDAPEHPSKWRAGKVARVVILFTDASYHETMSVPEARGGTCDPDIFNAIHSNNIVLFIFAPDMECYNRLSQADKSDFNAIRYGTEGPQAALAAFTADQNNFRRVMERLAKSVSGSARAVAVAL